MSDTLGRLQIDLEARIAKFETDMGRAARLLQRDMARAAATAQRAMENASRGQQRAAKQMADSVSRDVERLRRDAGNAAKAIAGIFAFNFGAGMVRDLAMVADGFANMQAKLKLVTQDSAQLGRVSNQVFAVSQRTFSSLDATATLVGRTTRALISNGEQADIALRKSLQLTETVQKAFAVSGATTAEAQNAIIQLSQGLAAGALRGEEFNSIAEQGPRIMQALADSLGVTTGALRAMAKDGKLTAEVIENALLGQAGKIDAEFQKLPLTIERAFAQVRNSFQQYVGEADQASGTSLKVAEAIQKVGDNLPAIATALTTGAAVAAAWFAVYRVGIPLINATGVAVRKTTADIVAMNVAQTMGIKAAGTWGSRLFAVLGGWPAVALAAAGAAYYLWDALEAGEERARATGIAAQQLAENLERVAALQAVEGRGVAPGLVETVSAYEEMAAQIAEIEERMERVGSRLGQGTSDSSDIAVLSELSALQERADFLRESMLRLATATGMASKDIVADLKSLAADGGESFGELVDGVMAAGAAIQRLLGMSGEAGATASAAAAFSEETEKTIAALNRQIETFGLAASAMTMYEAQIAASKAATEAERKAILDKASALAALQRKQEAETGAKKAAAVAARELAKQQRELEKAEKRRADLMRATANARAEFLKNTRDLAAQLKGPLAVATNAHADAIADLQEAYFEGAASAEQAAERMALLDEAFARTREEIEANTEEAQWLQSILDEFNNTGLNGLVNEIERVGDALRDAQLDESEKQAMLAYYDDLQRRANDFRQQGLERAIGATQMVISSMQSMADEGSDAYKAMELAQHGLNLALAIGGIVNQAQGDPYTAWARMAAMAITMASYIGQNVGGGGSGPSGAEARQQIQGTGTILGDDEAKSESILNALEITADATEALVGINRGMLRALQSMQAGIGNAAAGIARTEFMDLSLSDAAFANAFGPLWTIGGALLGSIFGGEQELIDQGLLIQGGLFGNVSRNPQASTYQTIETDGGWFGSDDIDDELEALSESARTQISLILQSIGDAVFEGAVALGLNAEQVAAAIEAYRLETIRISTMDLTGEEAQAELEAVFSSIFDGLAGSIVPFIGQFQRVGEGLGETLVRVATGVQVTQEAILRLGFALDETRPEQFAQISEALLEMVGGIDAFIEGIGAFFDAFAPEVRQFEVLQSDIGRALAEVGLAVPLTRDAMWELMQSLDATTESGREQIAALLRLADVSDAYYSTLEKLIDSYAGVVSDAREELLTGGLSDVQRQLVEVRVEEQQRLRALQESAYILEGMAAREEDLATVREAAQARIDAIIAQLTEQAADLVETLFGAGSNLEAMQSELSDLQSSLTEATTRLEELRAALAEYAGTAAQIEQTLADGLLTTDFQRNVRAALREQANLEDQLQRQAIAAGMAAAREQDLAGAREIANRQIAELLADLEGEALSQVETLYGAAADATSALGDVVEGLRLVSTGVQEFLDGLSVDARLSPLNARQRLEQGEALLRAAVAAGDIQQAQSLTNNLLGQGRSFFASGGDYGQFFDRITGIFGMLPRTAQEGGGAGPAGVADASFEIDRAAIARQLAQQVADILSVTGESIDDVLDRLGIPSAERFAADLGIGAGDLGDFLASLQANGLMQVPEALQAAQDRIAAGLEELSPEIGELVPRIDGLRIAIDALTAEVETLRLAEEDAARDAERITQASDLARVVADLASATGQTVEEVAAGLGFALSDLGALLGVEDVVAFLSGMVADTDALALTLSTLAEDIAAELWTVLREFVAEIPEIIEQPPVVPEPPEPVDPAPPPPNEPPPNPGRPPIDEQIIQSSKSTAENTGETVDVLEQMRAIMAQQSALLAEQAALQRQLVESQRQPGGRTSIREGA